MGVATDETRHGGVPRAEDSSSGTPRIIYKPRPETTPDSEARVLANVYTFILQHHRREQTVDGSTADTNTTKVESGDISGEVRPAEKGVDGTPQRIDKRNLRSGSLGVHKALPGRGKHVRGGPVQLSYTALQARPSPDHQGVAPDAGRSSKPATMKVSRANLEQATRFCRTLYGEGTPAPELVASGEVPLYKTGKLCRLRRADVECWLEECKHSPGDRQ